MMPFKDNNFGKPQGEFHARVPTGRPQQRVVVVSAGAGARVGMAVLAVHGRWLRLILKGFKTDEVRNRG